MIFNNGLAESADAPVGSRFIDALAAFGLDEEEEGVIVGDVNQDGVVSFADIPAFIALLISRDFLEEADINGDGEVSFADIPEFIEILIENAG